MKTNPHFICLVSLTIALGATILSSPAVAQVNTLTLEETSRSSLTATYTPASPTTTTFTVIPTSPDSWVVSSIGGTFDFPSVNWIEPENSSLSNQLSFGGNTISVQSDFGVAGAIPDEGTAFNVGMDLNNFLRINVVFDDDAATAETPTAPDTGSTFGLLALALAALLGAHRLRSIRLA